MKKLIVLIGLFSFALHGKSQVYLDFGYRLSVDNQLGFGEGDYYRGVDFHISWCDCSSLTLGIQTREVYDGVSIHGPSYFPSINFNEFNFSNDELSGYSTRKDVRIPLNYFRRYSPFENFYVLANVGMYVNLNYVTNKGYSSMDWNDEYTKKITFDYHKNPNKSFVKMDQLGVMGGLSMEYYIKPIGAFFVGINFQRNFKPFTDHYDLYLTEKTVDANGAEVSRESFNNQFSQKRTTPTLFFEFGFKTCGFNLSGNKKRKRSPSNGAWPF